MYFRISTCQVVKPNTSLRKSWKQTGSIEMLAVKLTPAKLEPGSIKLCHVNAAGITNKLSHRI